MTKKGEDMQCSSLLVMSKPYLINNMTFSRWSRVIKYKDIICAIKHAKNAARYTLLQYWCVLCSISKSHKHLCCFRNIEKQKHIIGDFLFAQFDKEVNTTTMNSYHSNSHCQLYILCYIINQHFSQVPLESSKRVCNSFIVCRPILIS